MLKEIINTVIDAMPGSESGITIYEQGKKTERKWNAVFADVCRACENLKRLGLSPGDRVGIYAANCYEWVVADLACLAGGFITVPFDPEIKAAPEELAVQYNLHVIFIMQPEYTISFPVLPLNGIHHAAGGSVPASFKPWLFKPEDIVSFKFTSGSTSSPKMIGVMRHSVDAVIDAVQQMFHHGPADRMLVFLPLHTYQMRYWVYSSILFGYELLLVPKQLVFFSLQTDRITVVMGIPHFYETFVKMIEAECSETGEKPETVYRELTCGTLRYLWTGSAPISMDTLSFYFRMGTPLYQGYGMNETCIVSKNYPGHNKTGSVGKLLPHQEVKTDADGQVLVRNRYPVNRSYTICKEGDNEKTFLPDGFVATGDMGYVDADGYLFITGRIKELIVLANARKIHPHIIEKAIEESPLIARCMVYGDSRPYLVALIVPEKKGTDERTIRNELQTQLSGFPEDEHIARFCLLDEPFSEENGQLSAQKKIRRNVIAAKYMNELINLYS